MISKNNILTFGAYHWRILDVKEDTALVITKDIVELRWYYNKFEEITWADCEIRNYLDHEFYNSFSEDEKKNILTVTNENNHNPWFSTEGGNQTIDKIFLLGLDEVCAYFGDSREKLWNKSAQKWQIEDENNCFLQAKYENEFHWWRLRSPGYYSRTSASVSKNGCVYVRGNGVYGKPKDSGGIRPALHLKISGLTF